MPTIPTKQAEELVGEIPEEHLEQRELFPESRGLLRADVTVAPDRGCERPVPEQCIDIGIAQSRIQQTTNLGFSNQPPSHLSNSAMSPGNHVVAPIDTALSTAETVGASKNTPRPPCTNERLGSMSTKESKTASPGSRAPENVAGLLSKHETAKDRENGDVVLLLTYREGESPTSEILRLEGGQGLPVIVESVAGGSKAARAGVGPGYALVSMNGRKEFMQLPAWQIHLLLEAPITLGFDPAPQNTPKLVSPCTEIRLKRCDENIGVAPKVAVCGKGMLAEEVVFKPRSAPLFLKTTTNFQESSAACEPSAQLKGKAPLPTIADATDCRTEPAYIYELRRRDAQVLVGRAVHGARAVVEPKLEVECVVVQDLSRDAPEYHSACRAVSPVSYCSLDCVAECIDSQDYEKGPKRNRMVIHKSIGRPALGQRDAALEKETALDDMNADEELPSMVSSHLAERLTQSPKKMASRMANQTQSERNRDQTKAETDQTNRSSTRSTSRCACGPEQDEDDWMNFRSSRSPLRWLAPVLEPMVRAFSPSRSSAPAMSPNSSASNASETIPMNAPRKNHSPFQSRAPVDSPRTPYDRRRRDDSITPIFKDIKGLHSPRGVRIKSVSPAVIQPNQVHDMPPAASSPLPSRIAFADIAHTASCPTGPRSLSPRNRALLGDRTGDGTDYAELPKANRSRSKNSPSFCVSWKKDMLDSDFSKEEATVDQFLV